MPVELAPYLDQLIESLSAVATLHAVYPRFWFVIDRAIAEEHAIPLVGPPWSGVFDPVPRDELLAALDAALDEAGALNAARAWAWLEDGAWISKPDAERWLVDRARAALRAAA